MVTCASWSERKHMLCGLSSHHPQHSQLHKESVATSKIQKAIYKHQKNPRVQEAELKIITK